MTTRKKSQSDRGKGGGAVGGKKVLPTCRMWLCVKCEEPIGEDDEAIECYRCKEWCHRSCSELTVNQFGCCKEGGTSFSGFVSVVGIVKVMRLIPSHAWKYN